MKLSLASNVVWFENWIFFSYFRGPDLLQCFFISLSPSALPAKEQCESRPLQWRRSHRPASGNTVWLDFSVLCLRWFSPETRPLISNQSSLALKIKTDVKSLDRLSVARVRSVFSSSSRTVCFSALILFHVLLVQQLLSCTVLIYTYLQNWLCYDQSDMYRSDA